MKYAQNSYANNKKCIKTCELKTEEIAQKK